MARPIDAFRIRDIKTAYTVLRSFDLKDDEYKTIVLDLANAYAYERVLEQVSDLQYFFC